MHRRQFLFTSAACALSGVLAGTASSSIAQTSTLDAVVAIKTLRINTGPFAGGYLIAPAGLLNWYFTNHGLAPIVQYLNAGDLDLYIRRYLDLYLQRLEPDAAIRDVVFSGGNPNAAYQLVLSDSDDSYAATLLTLAVRYLRASRNWSWWEANRATLKMIAYRNLAVTAKPNGLTSVFQAPRNQSNAFGYLMDNCEAYRGLRDFASLLRERGDISDANYYDGFADRIAAGIASYLFDTARSGFKPSDGHLRAETSFYPGTTCQVFPQAFDVSELSSYYSKGWNYLNRFTPNWQDGRYDPYPWAILGFVAAKRKQNAVANAQMRTVENAFIAKRAVVTINELGFYQRTKSLLAGRADI
jgi:hypothetical protein